jgi:hypothetical protein
VALAGVSQLIGLERGLGVSGGHKETLTFVEHFLGDGERRLNS